MNLVHRDLWLAAVPETTPLDCLARHAADLGCELVEDAEPLLLDENELLITLRGDTIPITQLQMESPAITDIWPQYYS